MMKKSILTSVLAMLFASTLFGQQPAATETPAATVPAASAPMPSSEATVRQSSAGETVLTFEKVTIGRAVPSWTAAGVTFTLASPPANSRAQGRVMFFPHLKTERRGILNAMANEQGIPVKAEIAGGATSVTLVLWGTIGCRALLEAHDKDGKLVDSATLPGTVPERKSPSDPIPSFELSVKGENIAYILFGGAPNGSALVADEMRYVPAK
jgi:hypothetical protein